MASKQHEYLDANWLLGEDETRATWGKLWSRTVLCLFLAGIAVWSWPHLSKWYLQRQFLSDLQNASTAEAAVRSLQGLGKLLPDSAVDIVEGFCHSDDEPVQLAFDLLQQHLERSTQLELESRRIKLQSLIVSIDRRKSRFSMVGADYARTLLDRMGEVASTDTSLIGQSTLAKVDQLQVSLDPNAIGNADGSEPARIVRSETFAPPTTLAPLGSDEVARGPATAPTTRMSLSDVPRAPAPSPTRLSLSDAPVEPLVQESSVKAISDSDSQPRSDRPTGSVAMRISSIEPESTASEAATPVLVAKPRASEMMKNQRGVRGSASTVIRAVDSKEAVADRGATSLPISETLPGSSPMAEQVHEETVSTIEGIDRLETGEVIRLLCSAQPKIVNAAFIELQRRNFESDRLSLAVELAQGSTRQRLECMQRLTQSSSISPIPWLLWMAEDGDREVRLRAINHLGAIADSSVATQLRLLFHREKDGQIRDQIQHLLAGSGNRPAASSTLR